MLKVSGLLNICPLDALRRKYKLKHAAEDGDDSGSDDLNPFQIESGKMAADTQVRVIQSVTAWTLKR